jgi:hypothetical protein
MKMMLFSLVLYIALFITAVTASAGTPGPISMASGGHVAHVSTLSLTSAMPETPIAGVVSNSLSLLTDGDHDRDDHDGDHDRDHDGDHDHDHHDHDKGAPSPTPEPATAVLAGVALLVGGGLLRHRRTTKQS